MALNNESNNMKNNAVSEDSDHRHIIFELNKEYLSLGIHYIREIIEVDNIREIPKLSAKFEGVIHLREQVIPILNFNYCIFSKSNLDDFEDKIHNSNAILINSPSNPTGMVEDVKTLKYIEKVCKDLNKIIISDEVYKDLIYERENYFLKGPHVITINSFSKTFSMCGARVGYLWSNNNEFNQFNQLHF